MKANRPDKLHPIKGFQIGLLLNGVDGLFEITGGGGYPFSAPRK